MKRPSDGKEPETVVFVACSGSRDRSKGVPYCSKVCCMYTAKHAMLYKHKTHHGKAYVFYMDIRSSGKDYDEFVRRAIEEDDVNYIRGRVSRIYEEDGKLVVMGADTLQNGRPVEIKADMVVLATAVQAQDGSEAAGPEAARELRPLPLLRRGPPQAQARWRPTPPGIFLAGACQAPRDIPETVAQASGAAAKVAALFSQDQLTREPQIAVVNRLPAPGLLLLRGLLPVPERLPLPGHRAGGDQGPGRQRPQDRRQGQPRPVPGLRHLRRHLPHQGHRHPGLQQRTDLRRNHDAMKFPWGTARSFHSLSVPHTPLQARAKPGPEVHPGPLP